MRLCAYKRGKGSSLFHNWDLNPFRILQPFKSNQHQISSQKYQYLIKKKVMRINKMITKGKSL